MKPKLCRQFGNLFTDLDHEIVREGLEQLPSLEQTAVALHFWQGLSYPQIARVLEISSSEVKSVLSNAFAELEAYCLSHPSFSLSHTSKAA